MSHLVEYTACHPTVGWESVVGWRGGVDVVRVGSCGRVNGRWVCFSKRVVLGDESTDG